jgi:hypothetical protein
MEEHRKRLLQKRAQRRTLGPKKDEVSGGTHDQEQGRRDGRDM